MRGSKPDGAAADDVATLEEVFASARVRAPDSRSPTSRRPDSGRRAQVVLRPQSPRRVGGRCGSRTVGRGRSEYRPGSPRPVRTVIALWRACARRRDADHDATESSGDGAGRIGGRAAGRREPAQWRDTGLARVLTDRASEGDCRRRDSVPERERGADSQPDRGRDGLLRPDRGRDEHVDSPVDPHRHHDHHDAPQHHDDHPGVVRRRRCSARRRREREQWVQQWVYRHG